MPRSDQQNRQMRKAARAAILESAMFLFAQDGYAHTTTRNIARQAGISVGLMYHYFESKEGLLHAVFDNCMLILDAAFRDSYERSASQQRLSSLLSTMFALLVRDRAFWSLFYMLRSQPAILRELGDEFRMWTRRLRELFEAEFRDAGKTDPELDALLLYSLVEGTIQQYLLDPDNYPLDQVTEHIINQYGTFS